MKRAGRVCVVLVALAAAPSCSLAQGACDALITRALNEFETAPRVRLLVEALNPAIRCASWPRAVQALAQTLIEDRNDSLAAVWLRWAARRDANLVLTTADVLPRVTEAYRAARQYVSRSRSAADSLTRTDWLWPGSAEDETAGRLQVNSPLPSLRAQIVGAGLVTGGETVTLSAGSYEITASASGHDSLRVTREVLPGVTTVVELRLRTTLAGDGARPPPSPSSTGRKFPMALVAGGAAALGVIVWIAARPNKEETGGISITIPN
jgi:hypothetical protein